VYLEDSADYGTIREHVEVIVAPLAGWTASGRASENELMGHFLILPVTGALGGPRNFWRWPCELGAPSDGIP